MKTWRNWFNAAMAAAFILLVAALLGLNEKACCLCSRPYCYAPCLIDLETGAVEELSLSSPEEIAEDPTLSQQDFHTFSFIRLGNVTGTKQLGEKRIDLNIPLNETVFAPALCKACRSQLKSFLPSRYVLADMSGKILLPLLPGQTVQLRRYEIRSERENEFLKVTIRGIWL